jgi:hypothetical protein
MSPIMLIETFFWINIAKFLSTLKFFMDNIFQKICDCTKNLNIYNETHTHTHTHTHACMHILILEPSHTPFPPPTCPPFKPKNFHLGRFPESVGMPTLLTIFFKLLHPLWMLKWNTYACTNNIVFFVKLAKKITSLLQITIITILRREIYSRCTLLSAFH